MSRSVQNSPRLVSFLAAVAITCVLQGALFKGFDQMSRESQLAAATSDLATPTGKLAGADRIQSHG